MSEERAAAKLARLRAGESSVDEATVPTADSDFDTLRRLRVLDERVEAARYPPLLDAIDRRILDAGLAVGRIDCAALAVALGVHRSTIWRRVQRLLARAPALHRRGTTLLGEAGPQRLLSQRQWNHFMAMAKTYAWAGIGPRPDGALALDDYNKLAAVYGAGFDARQLLNPPILTIERHGEKLRITGPGPVHPIFQAAVRAGLAERIFPGPPRCHACGRFISRSTTGRPPKYCGERCRSRSRRRPR